MQSPEANCGTSESRERVVNIAITFAMDGRSPETTEPGEALFEPKKITNAAA
jgi:hypothetical protein